MGKYIHFVWLGTSKRKCDLSAHRICEHVNLQIMGIRYCLLLSNILFTFSLRSYITEIHSCLFLNLFLDNLFNKKFFRLPSRQISNSIKLHIYIYLSISPQLSAIYSIIFKFHYLYNEFKDLSLAVHWLINHSLALAAFRCAVRASLDLSSICNQWP